MSGGIVTITVKCDLDNDEIFGRVHVQTTADKKLDWLLNEFCTEKRVKRKPTFALRRDTHEELDLQMSIAAAGLHDGETVFAFNKDPPPPPPPPSAPSKGFSKWWLLAAVALCIGAVGIVTVVLVHTLTMQSKVSYGIVVDAGASKSSIFLYSWPAEKLNGTGEVRQSGRADTAEPIEDTSGVEDIQKAVLQLSQHIPQERRQRAPLLLGATDGMLLYRKQNASSADAVMRSARRTLSSPESNGGLLVSQPSSQLRELDGDEAAVNAWLTVNYLGDTLASPVGLLQLNRLGASVAFPVAADASAGARRVSVYGRSSVVYAHAFACYGLAAVRLRALGVALRAASFAADRATQFSCWRRGRAGEVAGADVFGHACSAVWFGADEAAAGAARAASKKFLVVGSGDSSRCRLLVSRFFNSTCSHESCSFNDVYQPAPRSDLRFLAVDAYADTAGFFNATPQAGRLTANLSELGATVDSFCSHAGRNDSQDSTLAWRCFDGIFVDSLLQQGFGFNETSWAQIRFVRKVSSKKLAKTDSMAAHGRIAWSLGLMLQQSNRVAAEEPSGAIPLPVFIGTVVLFSALLLLSVLFACLAIRSRPKRGYRAF